MTRDELERLLAGRTLHEAIDIRTLMLDQVREMSTEAMLDFFWERLPSFSAEMLEEYFYMKRI